jgi:hypothetical protein
LDSLHYTDRFDEFPAICARFDRHEIILFDVPGGESAEVESQWNYGLEIFPTGCESDREIEDVSEKLFDCLSARGLRCFPSQ